MDNTAIRCLANGWTYYAKTFVDGITRPTVYDWTLLQSEATGTTLEIAASIVGVYNRFGYDCIRVNGELIDLRKPHYVAGVLGSYEVER